MADLADQLPVVLVGRVDRLAGTTESDDTGAGQSGDVDNQLWLERVRVAQGVCEHQSALGVGVVDLNALAVHREHHVTRLRRFARRQILGQRDQTDDVHLRLHFGQCGDRGEHVRGTTHVHAHLVHRFRCHRS